MKKIICVFFAILTLIFLIVPSSADNIEDNSNYIIRDAFTGISGIYAIYDSDNNIIEYFVTNDYLYFLESIYPDYKSSSQYQNGSDFEGYIWERYRIETSISIVYSIAGKYQQSQLMNEAKKEFEDYKSNDSTITEEEFSSYLQVSNPYLSWFYEENLSSFISEMITASKSTSGSSSGTTIPGENQGENYGKSHINNNHIITDSDCCYNPGYNDGILDGADEFKESNEYQETINNSKTEAVEQFKQSIEYKETLESIRVEADEYAVDNYLKSSEYEATKDSCYAAGSNVGYTNAYSDLCSDVYYRGVADGYSSFRGSNDHMADMDSSYRMGYDDGVSTERKNAVNPGAVIALMIILFVLLAVLISLFQIKKKKLR